ncbi:conserved hypothetical protein [Verticillium alfalfae VaMs.102]|uniref:JmjC domain-containing protein n=1 Tax=Verticillium alfalfae (strain VaMs.102 / ATCC MYA-4576 / FGSC 10136) TaxID=526221 RepID=C9SDC9_VERA1|nr:conserved hypothetical protein [Verticillium alfalfae VaMs.102]EEY17081.1 conserved hypothetical protein [Verticillium alfalfae VaMs.102]
MFASPLVSSPPLTTPSSRSTGAQRRASQPSRRRIRRADVSNHIDVEDLQRIMQWWENGTYPRKHLREEDLPPGYGFDDFHLMVPLEHAWPPIKSASSSPVSWPATSLITPVRSIRESVKTAATAAAAATAAVAATPQWSPYRLVPIPRERTTLAPPKTKVPATQSTGCSENPAGEIRGHHPPPATPVAADPRCVCPDDVPSMLLLALDIPTAFTPAFATKLIPLLGKLCRPHLQHFAEHTAAAMNIQPHITPTTAIETNPTNPTTSAASAAQRSVDEHRPKRQRVDDQSPLGTASQGRALHDRDADEAYRKQVLSELRQTVEDTIFPRSTHGEGTNRLIQELLEKAEPPNTSRDKGAIEMLFCSGDQAEALVDFESPHGAPIVTDGQQQFRWKTRERPIAQFLRRMGNLDRFISVQIPSRSALSESFEVRKLSEVKSRYLADESTDDPWNILDLQSPFRRRSCRVFFRARIPSCSSKSATPVSWKENCREGRRLQPTVERMAGRAPLDRQSGLLHRRRWGYTVLKPGQTVFFVSGTIHFVFRIRAPQTLALGGHVLQWSGLERWMAIVLTQMQNPSITNEDMGISAAKYVGVVSRLVAAKVNEDRSNGLEIEDRILRFLGSVKAFETAYGQLSKKKRRSPAGSKKRAR